MSTKIFAVSDRSNFGGWSPTPLWQEIDDDDLADVITSPEVSGVRDCSVNLSTAWTRVSTDAGWRVEGRARGAGGDLSSIRARLELRRSSDDGLVWSRTTVLSSFGSWTSIGGTLVEAEAQEIPAGSPGLYLAIIKVDSESAAAIDVGYAYLLMPDDGFQHLDLDTGALRSEPASSGHYLELNAGVYRRVTGTEGASALVLDGGLPKRHG